MKKSLGAMLAATCLAALAPTEAGAILPDDRRLRTYTADLRTADAEDGISWNGACVLATTNDPTLQVYGDPIRFTGMLAGAAAAYRPVDPSRTVDTSVLCEVRVNNVTKGSTYSGVLPNAAATADEVQFLVGDLDVVSVCGTFRFDDYVTTRCVDAAESTYPQDELGLNSLLVLVDPTICPVIGLLSPLSVPGLLEITPFGDIYLSSVLWYDCPPYEA